MLRPLGSTYSSMHCPKSFVVFISRDHVLKLNMCLLHSDLVVMHVHNVCLDSCPGEEKKNERAVRRILVATCEVYTTYMAKDRLAR